MPDVRMEWKNFRIPSSSSLFIGIIGVGRGATITTTYSGSCGIKGVSHINPAMPGLWQAIPSGKIG